MCPLKYHEQLLDRWTVVERKVKDLQQLTCKVHLASVDS